MPLLNFDLFQLTKLKVVLDCQVSDRMQYEKTPGFDTGSSKTSLNKHAGKTFSAFVSGLLLENTFQRYLLFSGGCAVECTSHNNGMHELRFA